MLGEWIPHSPRCVTWVSLDKGDNDPVRFWSYAIASLQMLRSDLGKNTQALLDSPHPPTIGTILTSLANEISAFSEVFTFVLDDYHVIEAQPIHEGLAFLLEHLPRNMHVIITSRADPPLPLARMRARQQLTELRTADLRFISAEAGVFFNEAMKIGLAEHEVAALEQRTEGWIAGLQMAALSMQGREEVSTFIQAFTGDDRYILDYLIEEVFQRQPEHIQNFLLQTSILNRLCGSLCDSVLSTEDDAAARNSHAEIPNAQIFRNGRYATLHAWLEKLPETEWHTRPDLCLWYAWAMLVSNKFEQYEQPLRVAERTWQAQANTLKLAQGNLSETEKWLAQFALQLERDTQEGYEIEYLTQARLHLNNSAYEKATKLLQRLQQAAYAEGRMNRAIECLTLEALALNMQRQLEAAFSCLAKTLALAVPENFVRVFVDEGAPMAEGLSNHEIAKKLYLATNTVKRHVNNIYAKLDVHSRTQAVAKGKELKVLGDCRILNCSHHMLLARTLLRLRNTSFLQIVVGW